MAAALLAVAVFVLRCRGAGPSTISVVDEGARAGDGHDDGPAIRRALAAAAPAGHPFTVTFPPGRYDVSTNSSDGPFLTLTEADDVTLSGAGAEIDFGTPDHDGLAVTDSARVRIDGLTFDWATPPFAQGRVMAVGGDTIDVRVEPGFPGLDAPWFGGAEWGTRHDPTTGRLLVASADLYPVQIDPVPVAARTWRMTVTSGIGDLRPGDGFVVPIRDGGAAVVASGSSDVSFRDLTVRSAPGSAFASLDAPRFTLTHSRVAVRPGSGRWISASGDGLHHSGGGTGPTVTGNTFAGMLDDGVNIYSVPAVVEEAADDELVVRRERPIAVGARVEVFDAVAGRVRASSEVRHVAALGGDRWRVRLARAVADVRAGGSDADQLYLVDDVATGFVVAGNRFADHRARGVVARGRDGRITDNTFERLPSGVVVANEPDWPEGNVPSGITIEGNHFVDTGRDRTVGAGAAIVVEGMRLGHELADAPLVSDVVVRNNVVRGADVAVAIGAARRVRIDDTTVEGGPDPASPVLDVRASTDVVVRGLHLVGRQRACPADPATVVRGRAALGGLVVDGTAC